MASLRWASRYRCDFCGAVADLAPRDDDEVYPVPVPAGWIMAYQQGPALRLQVHDVTGEVFGDMCAECVALPVGQVLATLERRLRGAAR